MFFSPQVKGWEWGLSEREAQTAATPALGLRTSSEAHRTSTVL